MEGERDEKDVLRYAVFYVIIQDLEIGKEVGIE